MQPFDADPSVQYTGAASALPTVEFTPALAAERFLPVFQYALRGIEQELRDALGWLAWTAAKPTWWILTRAIILRITLRVSIEMAVGSASPWVLPVVEGMVPLVDRFVQNDSDRREFAELLSLLRYPRERMTPAVQEALAAKPTFPVD